jgi:type VI secretion system protein ImpJ
MSGKNRVIWSEGMFLRPHHFQQQDRFYEGYIQHRCSGLKPYTWGFSELELDKEQLALGKIAIRSCTGVLPDGTPVNVPEVDPAPAPLELPKDTANHIIYLSLPSRRSGAVESDADKAVDNLARQVIGEEEVRDSTAAADSARVPLQIGTLRLRLMHQEEERDGYQCMGLARVVEVKSDRTVMLDSSYIPPVTDCKVNHNLMDFIKELQGLLHTRGEALAGRITDAGRGGTAEIADFMLLQLVNRAEPLMTHFSQVSQLHPEALYRDLVQLAGEFTSFDKSRRPAEIDPYVHDALDTTFRGVMESLRQSLGAVMEHNAILLPLTPPKFGIRAAKIPDRNLLGKAAFVLAVHADMPADSLRSRFPPQVKIGPVEHIQKLVQSALPGITLRALPVAPRQIPYHAGFCYFELDKHSKIWQQMATSGGFAIHIGGEFPAIELEFWAIKGN